MTGKNETDNVINFPTPKRLTDEQQAYWLAQAGYWGEHEEIAMRQLEYAQRMREHALRNLGMLGIEKGLQ